MRDIEISCMTQYSSNISPSCYENASFSMRSNFFFINNNRKMQAIDFPSFSSIDLLHIASVVTLAEKLIELQISKP